MTQTTDRTQTTAAPDSAAFLRKAAEDLSFISRRLVDFDQVEWYGGNLSVRDGDDCIITRTVSNKGAVEGASVEDEVVRTGIYSDDENTAWASSALAIHRAIYRKTTAKAVLHAHPRWATLLSLYTDEIIPIEENGRLYLGDSVRVVAAPELFGWNLVADELADALDGGRLAVMLKWHGSFSIGQTLNEAMHNSRALNNVAEFIIRARQLEPVFGLPTPLPTVVSTEKGGAGTRILPPAKTAQA